MPDNTQPPQLPICPLSFNVITIAKPMPSSSLNPNAPQQQQRIEQTIAGQPCVQGACMWYDAKKNTCSPIESFRIIAEQLKTRNSMSETNT